MPRWHASKNDSGFAGIKIQIYPFGPCQQSFLIGNHGIQIPENTVSFHEEIPPESNYLINHKFMKILYFVHEKKIQKREVILKMLLRTVFLGMSPPMGWIEHKNINSSPILCILFYQIQM